ncbi:hypothetical protein FXN80_13740 [Dickeya fangzhongdai]|uniref:hypothetical protein n=1 Tax=Dickeya fangzhongdai TaxID=1778540 RepID=UPI00136B3450|nr:hypothetical protein [Dickeya fangzhongdai]UMB75186.1 hypothetical protein FXN80_13740 [Dickeya fangzhongdai]
MTSIQKVVLYSCVVSMAMVIAGCRENLVWRLADSYPYALSQIRYVEKAELMTPQAMRHICNLPLTPPELVRKANGLFLRCGTPGFEGMYRIELYGK